MAALLLKLVIPRPSRVVLALALLAAPVLARWLARLARGDVPDSERRLASEVQELRSMYERVRRRASQCTSRALRPPKLRRASVAALEQERQATMELQRLRSDYETVRRGDPGRAL
jgi:hypothetical protein